MKFSWSLREKGEGKAGKMFLPVLLLLPAGIPAVREQQGAAER